MTSPPEFFTACAIDSDSRVTGLLLHGVALGVGGRAAQQRDSQAPRPDEEEFLTAQLDELAEPVADHSLRQAGTTTPAPDQRRA
jgi:hypothetical protein